MKTTILLDGEGQMPELQGALQGHVEKLAGFPRGMTSGQTSVALAIRLHGGGYVFAEMSLAHLQLAVVALTGRYGDETESVGLATNQTPKERQ